MKDSGYAPEFFFADVKGYIKCVILQHQFLCEFPPIL